MLVANLAKLELLLANPFAPPLQLAHRNLSAATEGTNTARQVPPSSTASHHRLNYRPLPYAHTA